MTELLTNAATPGQPLPLCSLLQAMPASTPGAVETYGVSAPAPPSLRSSSGQFRVAVDDEYMVVTAKTDGSSPWEFQRGMENSAAAAHRAGTSVWFILTIGGLTAVIDETAGSGGSQGLTSPSIDPDTGGVQFEVVSNFGIDTSTGFPYYDTDGATAGEAAVISPDAASGGIAYTLIGGQQS
jgi:hypothetical protein